MKMIKRLIVDADSCPVKDEIVQVAKEYVISVIFVASFAHFMSPIEGAQIIYVRLIPCKIGKILSKHYEKF